MRKLVKITKHAVLIFVTLVGLAPFLLILLTSLKKPNEAVVTPPKFIFTPTLASYKTLLGDVSFLKSVMNSLIIAGGATILATILAVLAGYALTRFRFRGTDWYIVSLFVPAHGAAYYFRDPIFPYLAHPAPGRHLHLDDPDVRHPVPAAFGVDDPQFLPRLPD